MRLCTAMPRMPVLALRDVMRFVEPLMRSDLSFLPPEERVCTSHATAQMWSDAFCAMRSLTFLHRLVCSFTPCPLPMVGACIGRMVQAVELRHLMAAGVRPHVGVRSMQRQNGSLHAILKPNMCAAH